MRNPAREAARSVAANESSQHLGQHVCQIACMHHHSDLNQGQTAKPRQRWSAFPCVRDNCCITSVVASVNGQQ
jgi:hypothetical protein